MYKELETDRLRIRPINLGDAKFIIRLVNSEGWLKYIGDRNITDKNEAEKYIQKILENQHYYYSIFELKSSNQPIGIVTFLNRENKDFPDIGFALLPEYGKMGYALEACKKYLDEIIKSNVYKNIIGITAPDNLKSISLLKKLGLLYEHDYNEDNKALSLFSLIQTKKASN